MKSFTFKKITNVIVSAICLNFVALILSESYEFPSFFWNYHRWNFFLWYIYIYIYISNLSYDNWFMRDTNGCSYPLVFLKKLLWETIFTGIKGWTDAHLSVITGYFSPVFKNGGTNLYTFQENVCVSENHCKHFNL